MTEGPAPGSGRGHDPASGPLPGFASGGPLDRALPDAALTRELDRADGPVDGTGGSGAAVQANTMLTIPAPTLLGQAERPGEAHGLGAIDPALARQLAAAAARHPRSTWCLTVTDDDGHAIAHGCARPARTKRKPGQATPGAARAGPFLTLAPAGPGRRSSAVAGVDQAGWMIA